ncbi:XRE family transcriptional regulator [Actinomadura graeca]|uniref:XRE family transcriptional regulator n=1 Tax=Actinomadura graeca TaxID=2750812 RepID=A0ABX8QRX2_9ACTN|nr:XRE family transcriptional regulator [Actinomadura graeca]QXJ21482.1 XRE family transcriptional regulator [Actinomadura graeca]
MKRRAALQIITAISAGAAVPPGAVETVLSGIDDALGGRDDDLPEWERTVADYDHRIHSAPAGALIDDLNTDIIAMGAVFERQLSPLQKAGFLRISAALAGLLAIELGDAGDHRATRIAWDTAMRAADASGDLAMRAWTRGRAAEDALWAGRAPQVVANLAAEAISLAGKAPVHGLARAYAACADLAAIQGHRVTEALADLHRAAERLPEPETAQSCFTYRETQLGWSEAFAYSFSGNPHAFTVLDQTRSLYPPHALAARANLNLMEALVRVKTHDTAGLDQALETVLAQERGSAGGRFIAKALLTALPRAARALPPARELRALTAAPVTGV